MGGVNWGRVYICVCMCVHVHKCLNTVGWWSQPSGRDRTNSKETEAKLPNPQVRGPWEWH